MQHDAHVIPESPKEPTDSSTTAYAAPAAGPGRAKALKPPQNRPDILTETTTGHDMANVPCTFGKPEANQTPPLPAATKLELSLNQNLRNSRQPLYTSSVLSVAESRKPTECGGFPPAEDAYQPAEFDIVVDAHPAGKSTFSSVFDLTHSLRVWVRKMYSMFVIIATN